MDPDLKLSTTDSPKTVQEFAAMRDKPYQEAVGSIQYTSCGTHLDMTYIMNMYLIPISQKPWTSSLDCGQALLWVYVWNNRLEVDIWEGGEEPGGICRCRWINA